MDAKELAIVSLQFFSPEALEDIKALHDRDNDMAFTMLNCYNYGVMTGKREERAKRKRGVTV